MASKLNKIKTSDSKKRKSPADDGLLVQCTPSEEGEKVECGPTLPLAVWCCKVAFMLDHECTLAFCVPCKEKKFLSSAVTTEEEGSSRNKMSKKGSRGNKTDIGVQIVACCPKGKCGRHSEAGPSGNIFH